MKTILMLALVFTANAANALEFEEVTLRAWSRGETIFGEEFIAANETVADYLANLERPPKGTFKTFNYRCLVKGRGIRPSVWMSGGTGTGNQGYVVVNTVYDIKDCQRLEESADSHR